MAPPALRSSGDPHDLVPGADERPVLGAVNERWAMDLIHDTLAEGRSIRIVSVVDAFSRVCRPGSEAEREHGQRRAPGGAEVHADHP